MIHHEPWAKEASKEADAALARFVHGDESAFHDLRNLAMRGKIPSKPFFFLKGFTRSIGIERIGEWLEEVRAKISPLKTPKEMSLWREVREFVSAMGGLDTAFYRTPEELYTRPDLLDLIESLWSKLKPKIFQLKSFVGSS